MVLAQGGNPGWPARRPLSDKEADRTSRSPGGQRSPSHPPSSSKFPQHRTIHNLEEAALDGIDLYTAADLRDTEDCSGFGVEVRLCPPQECGQLMGHRRGPAWDLLFQDHASSDDEWCGLGTVV